MVVDFVLWNSIVPIVLVRFLPSLPLPGPVVSLLVAGVPRYEGPGQQPLAFVVVTMGCLFLWGILPWHIAIEFLLLGDGAQAQMGTSDYDTLAGGAVPVVSGICRHMLSTMWAPFGFVVVGAVDAYFVCAGCLSWSPSQRTNRGALAAIARHAVQEGLLVEQSCFSTRR